MTLLIAVSFTVSTIWFEFISYELPNNAQTGRAAAVCIQSRVEIFHGELLSFTIDVLTRSARSDHGILYLLQRRDCLA